MKPLSINFTWQPDRRLLHTSYLLLGVALLMASWVGWQAFEMLSALSTLAAERQTFLHMPESPRVEALSSEEKERQRSEFKMAQGIIERLDTPWGILFTAVESAFDDQVTLLNVEPDPERREVRLTAEAKDLHAMQAYIRQLRQAPALRDAYLASHQVNQQDPLHPVRFVANARWVVPAETPSASPEIVNGADEKASAGVVPDKASQPIAIPTIQVPPPTAIPVVQGGA
jgi:Tfp pilus assembly protein PilN